MFSEARRIGDILLRINDGIDMWVKTRPEMPETDIKRDHVHMHVIPSNVGDERYSSALTWEPGEFVQLSETDIIEMVAILRV